ncbi:VOC family protein [Paucibacter sp. PLA-PC-4]|nr:VOC family protein [Paucibacter sp. PLA-PC-4]
MPMLHHLSFGVRDLRRAADFYDAVLQPLGYVRVWTDFEGDEDTQAVGYGEPGGGDKLALKQCPNGAIAPGPGFHLAFSAPSREAVNHFHEAAMRSGGKDNGAPGLRPDYGPDYYAAYVVDPEGWRIEAVINMVA